VPFLDYDVENPQDHLLDECDRVDERPLRTRRRGPRTLPNEQAALKCLYLTTRSLDPTAKAGTMGHKVETGPERIRHHIRRPHPDNMITDQIRSTVYLIDRGACRDADGL
jgi:hypothetical protein